MAAVNILVVCI